MKIKALNIITYLYDMITKISYKKLAVIIGIIVLILIYLFKPNLYKKPFKYLKDTLLNEKEISQRVIDSLNIIRDKDYLNYKDKIDSLKQAHKQELNYLNNALIQETFKRRENEKALNFYRNNDFNKRFGIFAKTYNKQNPD